jgi:beta-phosphoglucomutase-like phosphatase (HAD superfamily)
MTKTRCLGGLFDLDGVLVDSTPAVVTGYCWLIALHLRSIFGIRVAQPFPNAANSGRAYPAATDRPIPVHRTLRQTQR